MHCIQPEKLRKIGLHVHGPRGPLNASRSCCVPKHTVWAERGEVGTDIWSHVRAIVMDPRGPQARSAMGGGGSASGRTAMGSQPDITLS